MHLLKIYIRIPSFKNIYIRIARFYRAKITKGQHGHSAIFTTLKFLNLPPLLRDKTETKPLLAIIDADKSLVHKYNKRLVEIIQDTWQNMSIYDCNTKQFHNVSCYILGFINDLESNRIMNYLKQGGSINGACM